MFKEPKIIFHHIPKCGGTSIVTGLAMTYYPMRLLFRGKSGFNARLNAPQTAEYAQKNDINKFSHRRMVLRNHVERQTCPFISGHYPFDYDLYDQQKEEWGFVTLLRDPIKRWYSEYYWNRYKDHDYRKTDMSMEEYLETPEGLENTRSFVNYFAMTENTDGAVTQVEQEEALKALPCFTVIGFLEELEKFRSDMKQAKGVILKKIFCVYWKQISRFITKPKSAQGYNAKRARRNRILLSTSMLSNVLSRVTNLYSVPISRVYNVSSRVLSSKSLFS